MSAGVYRPAEAGRDAARRRIETGPPLLLDGATGTELERRGLPTALPLWSAAALLEHPDAVQAIHGDYARAGVEVLTANTFRSQRWVLATRGLAAEAPALTKRAVALARAAAGSVPSAPMVFGSAPPIEDCYRPDLVPERAVLLEEHAEHARCLDEAGVDAVLVETMNSTEEAAIATRASSDRGLPTLTSFVCWKGADLLDGSPLEGAARACLEAGASAVLVNCLPSAQVAPCLRILAKLGAPFGAYANLGEANEVTGFSRGEDVSPQAFAREARSWLDAGAHVVGGCCGTTPAHLRALSRMLASDPER